MKQWRAHVWDVFRTKLWVVWVAVVLWWVIVGAIQWFRLQHHGYDGLDLSIYSQVLWDLVHGHGLWSSIQDHNYFADHVEPLLFLVLPLYRIWQSPLFLLWLQTCFIGLSVFPFRRIVEYTLGKQWQNIGALVFLLHVATWNIVLSEFHVVAFALPLGMWAISSYMELRFARFMAALLMLTFLREDIGLITVGFGIFALLRRRSLQWWFLPIITGIAGVLLIHALQSWIGGGTLVDAYFPWWVEITQGQIGTGLATLASEFWRASPYRMLAVIILAFGIVVVRGWEWWIPMLPMLFLFASTDRSIENIVVGDYHGAAVIPFLFVALCVGFVRVREWVQRRWKHAPLAMPVYVAVVAGVLLLPWATVWAVRPWAPTHITTDDTNRLEQRIGKSDGVVASANLLPHVANRAVAKNAWYVFKGHDELNRALYTIDSSVQWVLFDTNDFVDFTAKPEYMHEQAEAFRSLLRNEFTPVDESGSVILFRRGQSATGDEMEQLLHIDARGPESVVDGTDTPFGLYGTPALIGSVLTLQVQVRNADQWRALVARDNQRPVLHIRNGDEAMSLPLAYGFISSERVQTGDLMTMRIQVPDRVIGLSRTVEVVGQLVHPVGLYLGRTQSIARKDIVRSEFLRVTVQGQ